YTKNRSQAALPSILDALFAPTLKAVPVSGLQSLNLPMNHASLHLAEHRFTFLKVRPISSGTIPVAARSTCATTFRSKTRPARRTSTQIRNSIDNLSAKHTHHPSNVSFPQGCVTRRGGS